MKKEFGGMGFQRQIDPRGSVLQTFSGTGSVLKVITKGVYFLKLSAITINET